MADQAIDTTKLSAGAKAQSPFLPGTNIQFAWDSTSLGLFKTCPRLYAYTLIDGWEAKGESIHLRFGIEYHKALEDYDRSRATGTSHEDSIRQSVGSLVLRTADWEVDEDSRAGKYKNSHSLRQLVIDYLDHFRDDPAKTYILDNGKPAVELSFRFELDFGPSRNNPGEFGYSPGQWALGVSQPYLLCGHLDRVVDFNDQLLVMDRKTTTTTPGEYYFRQYEPNNQMSLYTLAGKVVLNSPIKGVVIDAAQVLIDKPNKFVRGFTYRTPAQLEEWVQDLRITLSVAESYATEGYWPMNDTACDKFGGCRFRDVCSKDPSVRENFLKADFNKLEPEDRWNPLKPR